MPVLVDKLLIHCFEIVSKLVIFFNSYSKDIKKTSITDLIMHIDSLILDNLYLSVVDENLSCCHLNSV